MRHTGPGSGHSIENTGIEVHLSVNAARDQRHERAPSAAVRDTIRPMSYDFAVLTRESVGIGGRKRWPRLSSLSSRTTSPTRSRTDACEILSPTLRKLAPRMRKTAGYRCGPSTSGRTASRYPTTYADVDSN